jgi:hypothetical protein
MSSMDNVGRLRMSWLVAPEDSSGGRKDWLCRAPSRAAGALKALLWSAAAVAGGMLLAGAC